MRPLPYVDPRRRRNPLVRILVSAASTGLVARLSTTAAWRRTVWRLDPWLLRLSGGRISTGIVLPAALLETRGARSGRARSSGVIYFHDDDTVMIVASQAGMATHPAWFHNARANPDVRLGGHPFTARIVTDPERVWPLADAVFPAFARYRLSAAAHGRTIPILQLVPRLD